MLDLTPLKKNQIARPDDVVDFYNLVENFFNDVQSPFRSLKNDTFKIDVKENDKEYIIDAEIAGYNKEDIHVKYNDDRLTISVSKKEEKNEENERYIHKERSFSSMQRTVYLPNVSESEVKAAFENGVLKVTAPKSKESEKKTEIKID
ncbi:Hsp20 family protein [Acetobacterium paludosum]|uniref:Hsp20 family protein n=1 Tax=Acetobacterium paludosum TaxID=52693 RepID=A0A923HTS2_9FIRM|nr:Hsp20/alpha crystallin family protein [Acetobacterium paludosum]MBC3887052.1 Hsp20 family protein [Acetobacterium paludosum]